MATKIRPKSSTSAEEADTQAVQDAAETGEGPVEVEEKPEKAAPKKQAPQEDVVPYGHGGVFKSLGGGRRVRA